MDLFTQIIFNVKVGRKKCTNQITDCVASKSQRVYLEPHVDFKSRDIYPIIIYCQLWNLWQLWLIIVMHTSASIFGSAKSYVRRAGRWAAVYICGVEPGWGAIPLLTFLLFRWNCPPTPFLTAHFFVEKWSTSIVVTTLYSKVRCLFQWDVQDLGPL